MSLLMICPSRDRPELAKRFSDSFLATTSHARLVVICDEDQRTYYKGIARDRVSVIWGGGPAGPAKAISLGGEFWEADVYGVMPDDCLFKTPGWDDAVLARAKERDLCVLSPASGYGTRIEMPFVTRKWKEVLGTLVPLNVYHFCWNTALAMLAEGLGPEATIHLTEEECFVVHEERACANRYKTDSDCVAFYLWAVFDYHKQLAQLRAA